MIFKSSGFRYILTAKSFILLLTDRCNLCWRRSNRVSKELWWPKVSKCLMLHFFCKVRLNKTRTRISILLSNFSIRYKRISLRTNVLSMATWTLIFLSNSWLAIRLQFIQWVDRSNRKANLVFRRNLKTCAIVLGPNHCPISLPSECPIWTEEEEIFFEIIFVCFFWQSKLTDLMNRIRRMTPINKHI